MIHPPVTTDQRLGLSAALKEKKQPLFLSFKWTDNQQVLMSLRS